VVAKFAQLDDGSQWHQRHWARVDATGSIEAVHACIALRVDAAISACAQGEPLRQLWDYGVMGEALLGGAAAEQGGQQAAAAAAAGGARENLPGKAQGHGQQQQAPPDRRGSLEDDVLRPRQ
jgi:hypothetical protein